MTRYQDYESSKAERKVSLHATVKNGKIIGLDGKTVPELREGASVTIRTHASNLVDKELRQSLLKETTVTLLEPSQKLYMALNTKLTESPMIQALELMHGEVSRELTDRLTQQDVQYLQDVLDDLFGKRGFEFPSGLLKCDGFVEIELNSPLTIEIKGGEPMQLNGCDCNVPYVNYMNSGGQEEYYSLNHACTQISEFFEKGRLSHSVNVFKKVFYIDEDCRGLRPLGFLRDNFSSVEQSDLMTERTIKRG